MRSQSRTGAGAAALSLLLLGAVICRCPVPMPSMSMTSAPSEHAHHHECCPDEPSVRAVDSDCCASLPESTSVIVKNERPSTALVAESFELPFAPTLEVRSARPFSIPLPPASPPLVLRI
jgi:hypothetical protein